MSDGSGIEWTDATWNPVSGCTKVSPGCDHCYAERITERFHGKGSFERVVLHPERLEAPLHWRRPRRVFVNSMSDLFHAEIPRSFLESVFDVMRACPRHTFQVLTKRAERMERLCRDRDATPEEVDDGFELGVVPGLTYDLPNVWLGVSVEGTAGYARIRHLQRTPAAVRFLSCEPLLGELPDLPLEGIGWVIVGGESGPGARPTHPDWVRSIHAQCVAAGVPFFFKQWGEWEPVTPVYPPDDDADGLWDVVDHDLSDHRVGWLTRDGDFDESEQIQPCGDTPWWMARSGKKAAGRALDGREWNEYPAVAT